MELKNSINGNIQQKLCIYDVFTRTYTFDFLTLLETNCWVNVYRYLVIMVIVIQQG